MRVKHRREILIRIILPLILCIILSSMARLVNAVIVFPLSHDFYLTAAMLGFMSGSFLFFSAIFQIPLGFLIDRHDPKSVIVILFAVAALGACIFAAAATPFGLTLGRAMMGVGFAGSTVLVLKVADLNLDDRQKSYYYRIILIGSAIGALLVASPSHWIMSHFGWRLYMILIALAAIAVATAVGAVIPYRLEVKKQLPTYEGQWKRLSEACRSPNYWRILIPVSVGYGTFLAMQGLWMGPWIEQGLGLSHYHIGLYLSISALGMLLGMLSSPLFKWLADRIRFGAIGVMGFFYGVAIVAQIFMLYLSFIPSAILWFIYGYSIQVLQIVFFIHSKLFPKALFGKILTTIQSGVLAMGFLVEVLVGVVVNIWSRDGSGFYPKEAFQTAFMLIALFNLIALGWLLLYRSKEEYAKR